MSCKRMMAVSKFMQRSSWDCRLASPFSCQSWIQRMSQLQLKGFLSNLLWAERKKRQWGWGKDNRGETPLQDHVKHMVHISSCSREVDFVHPCVCEHGFTSSGQCTRIPFTIRTAHRKAWVGRNPKEPQSTPKPQFHLPVVGWLPCTDSGCPGPHPTWPRGLPGMGNTYSSDSQ